MKPGLIGSSRRNRPSVLYVTPHQDDEQLTYGASIVSDVKAGQDVSVMLVTDGRHAGSRTSPTMVSRLGYTPNFADFSAARDREFVESVRRMGARAIVPPYGVREEDGASTLSNVRALVEAHCEPGSILRGTSQNDYHLDHRNVGSALISLEREGFGHSLRLMLSSYSVHNLGLGPPAGTPLHTIDNPPFPMHYQWPYRHVDVPEGWWGIGYLDVPHIFDVISDTDPDTYWHDPPPPPEAITLKGATSMIAPDSRSTVSLPVPSGGEAGDVYIIASTVYGSSPPASTVSGFTSLASVPLGTNCLSDVMARAHTGTEGTTFDITVQSGYTYVACLLVSGADVSGTALENLVHKSATLAGPPPTTPEVVTTVSDTLAISFLFINGGISTGPPAGWTDVVSLDGGGFRIATKAHPITGSTGTATWLGSPPDSTARLTIALKGAT